jgi:hypothetical protein
MPKMTTGGHLLWCANMYIHKQLRITPTGIGRLALAAFYAFVLGGCGNEVQSVQFNWDDPKIVAIEPAVRSLADSSIATEEYFHGKPLQLDYCVSIEPRISDGFAEKGETELNLLGTGVPGNLSFTCAAETIGSAQIAVVNEAILGADHELRTGTTLFIWRDGRWQSASDYFLETLEKQDPKTAEQIRKDLAQISSSRLKQRPTTAPGL